MIKFFDATGNQVTDGHVTTVIIVPGMLAPQAVRVPLYVDGELRPAAELSSLGVTVERTPEDWADKERLIGAVYALISAETIASVMTTPAALKDAIAGLALLATGAAPDGMINLSDPRVSQWLTLARLTLEQVKTKMEEA